MRRFLQQASLPATFGGAISLVAALESTLYLRNQLLRDADWAGMDHSLEICIPLVDFELLKQLASSLPNAGLRQSDDRQLPGCQQGSPAK